MQQYFVPYNIAKELKEIGFDEPCLTMYRPNQTLSPVIHGFDDDPDQIHTLIFNHDLEEFSSAPLYAQVSDWLERNYHLSIGFTPHTSGKHKYSIWIWNSEKALWEDTYQRSEDTDEIILKALELIKQKEDV